MLHPWGTDKTMFEATSPTDGKTAMMGNQYTNNNFARHGYRVVNFPSRAVFGSCGAVLGKVLLGNGLGNLNCPSDDFLHFADTRTRSVTRSTWWALVDDGLALPGFAVTGGVLRRGADPPPLSAAGPDGAARRHDRPPP